MSINHGSGPGTRRNAVVTMDQSRIETIRGSVPTDGPTPFFATFSLTSAAAATAVNILTEAEVGSGRKVYITSFGGKVNGATDWATTATVKIQDTNGSAVDFVTFAVASLTGNAEVGPFTATCGEPAFLYGTGGTAGKGLQIVGDANGTGSTLTGFVSGWII